MPTTHKPSSSATFGRSDGSTNPPDAPELWVQNVRVTEAHVIEQLKDLGDQALADYRSGKLSRDEAYRAAATWLRNLMELS